MPIVEPEVLMVTELTLRQVFAQLYRHRVQLEGTILKPNMIVPGKKRRRPLRRKWPG